MTQPRHTALKLGFTLAASLFMLANSGSTAQAATWHKGMPKAFIGKWKHHENYQYQNGKKYEYAMLFQGLKNGFAAGGTYSDTYYNHVRYNRYLGHHTYKILYNQAIGGAHATAYLHWYSHNKVGIKYSTNTKYYTYNSRRPVLNYGYSWIG